MACVSVQCRRKRVLCALCTVNNMSQQMAKPNRLCLAIFLQHVDINVFIVNALVITTKRMRRKQTPGFVIKIRGLKVRLIRSKIHY